MHSITIPSPSRTSSKIISQIAKILLTEKMHYSTQLVSINATSSSVVVSGLAGCNTLQRHFSCPESSLETPDFHLAFEVWPDGEKTAADLAPEIRPCFLSTLPYTGDDSLFIWQDLVDMSRQLPPHISLDEFSAFNATLYKPHALFEPWQAMLRLIPTALVIPCSQMLQDEFENAGQPGEESTACSADDAVWFSPACRQNTTECVPVLLQGRLDRVALLAEHLSLPLAAVVVSQGSSRYAEYFAAVRAGRFLFAYRSPDDTLTDEAGRAPVPVRLPQAGELPDALQEVQGQMEGVMLRTYAWQGLAAADRRVAWFAAAVGVSAAGMARMMHQTAGLRREGGPGPLPT